jgi:IclR family acetate operon transcriptional repressor
VAAVGFHRLTAHTITHADAFSKELDTVRHQGYAIDNEEQSIGLRCVAANIFNEYGDAIAAVSVSGPTVRLTNARLPDVAQHVVNIAEDITRTIGGVRPDAFLNVL